MNTAGPKPLCRLGRQSLAAGEEVAHIYQEPGLAWLERQADVAEELVTERQAAERHH